MLTAEDVRRQVEHLDRLVAEEHKPQHLPKKRNWRTYGKQLAVSIRQARRNSSPHVQEACAFTRSPQPRQKPTLILEQKLAPILLEILSKHSPRRMSLSLVAFSLRSRTEVSS